MKKKKLEKFKKRTEGVISIMLVVLMLPFFTFAAMFVEIGRFQSAMRTIDESIGISEYAVLAGYDSYLLKRFGILAVAQKTDSTPNDVFTKYFGKQKTIDDRSAEATDIEATGISPIADIDVLEQELESYYAILGPMDALISGLDVTYLKKQIEKLVSWIPFVKAFSSITNLADKFVKSADALDEAEKKADEAKDAKDDYDDAYDRWEKAMSALISVLKKDPGNPGDDEDKQKAYEQWLQDVADAQSTASSAANGYSKAIDSLIGKLDELNEKINSTVTAQREAVTEIFNTGAEVTKDTIDVMNSKLKDDYDELKLKNQMEPETVLAYDAEYNAQKDKLGNFKEYVTAGGSVSTQYNEKMEDELDTYSPQNFVSAISALQSQKGYITSSATKDSNASDICSPAHADIPNIDDLVNKKKVKEYVKQITKDVNASEGWDKLWALVDFFKSIFSTQLFFDSELNVDIDVDYYTSVYGGLPSTKDRSKAEYSLKNPYEDEDMSKSLEYLQKIDADYNAKDPYGESRYSATEQAYDDLMNAIETMKSDFDNLSDAKGFASKLRAVAKVIGSVVSVLLKMITLAGNFILELAKNFVSWMYSGLVINMYCLNKLPNRLNYATFTDISRPAAGYAQSLPIFGMFAGSQTNYSFIGAELEYLIVGSTSEIKNQTGVFIRLWILRFIPDIMGVMMNESLKPVFDAINAIPYVGPVLMVIAIILVGIVEAFLSVYMLVNGEGVSLVKSKPYCSPDGFSDLTKSLMNITVKKTQQTAVDKSPEDIKKDADKLIEKIGDKTVIQGDKYADELLKLDYSQHCLFFLLITSRKTKLNRLTDIIQMEMTMRNFDQAKLSEKISGNYAPFNIDEAYTGIRAKVSGKLVNLFPLPGISESSLLSFDRIVYRSY